MQVAEANIGEPELILAGIKNNGVFIANKIAAHLKDVYPGKVNVIALDIDKKNPGKTAIQTGNNFNDKIVVLIDDVANSGRTMLYAIEPMLADFPKKIQTLALVERTYKKFPVHLNFVGLSVSTSKNEYIEVLVENGEVTGAVINSIS